MDGHTFVGLFAAYWWLLFPLGWGVSMLIKFWQRARQTEKAMDIIKSYADQGQTPPPEVLAVLQLQELTLLQATQEKTPADPAMAHARNTNTARGLMLTSFIFAALMVAFGVLTASLFFSGDHDSLPGLLFVTALLGGFAAAFFTAATLLFRELNRRNDN